MKTKQDWTVNDLARLIIEVQEKQDYMLEHMATKEDIKRLDKRIDALQADVNVLKSDLRVLKVDVTELKNDVAAIKVDITSIRTELSEINERINKIENRLEKLDKRTFEDSNASVKEIFRLKSRVENIEKYLNLVPAKV